MKWYLNLRANIALALIFCLLTDMPLATGLAQAQEFSLPAAGVMVHLTPAFNPPILRGVKVYPDNPFRFDFILDQGDNSLGQNQLKEESRKLIKYFLASLTIPEKDQWVNLSPYEKDRITSEELGQTAMGQDLLAQDYILKQITASLIYPEDKLGKEFWSMVYKQAWERYGTTQIPVNTFNKVWIVADKAKVYVHDGTAFIVAAYLKVMLEEDYLSLEQHHIAKANGTDSIGANIVRQIVLPQLEKEVNAGRNFSLLRQIFYSMILATWYKQHLKNTILNQDYSNKAKMTGLTADLQIKKRIYQQYLEAYKKGAFNYIKEEPDGALGTIPRKYFSGGVTDIDRAEVVSSDDRDVKRFEAAPPHGLLIVQARIDAAMESKINLDVTKPVLLQIYEIKPSVTPTGKSILDRDTATAYAQEFITQLLNQPPDNAGRRAIEKALSIFKQRTVIIALRDYFIKEWQERGIGQSTFSNKRIVTEATSWLRPQKDPAKAHLYDNRLKDKEVLVIGGSGSIGVPFTAEFLRKNKRLMFSFQRNAPPKPVADRMGENTGGRDLYITGDLRNPQNVLTAMELMKRWRINNGPEAETIQSKIDKKDPHLDEYIDGITKEHLSVVHMGALAFTYMDMPATIMANIVNTINVLKSMRKTGINKLVFISSRIVHDVRQNPYAMAKYIEEKIIKKYCEAHGMKYVTLRPSNMAGSSKIGSTFVGDQNMRLIRTLVDRIKKGGKFRMAKEAKNTRIGFIDFDELPPAISNALTNLFNNEESSVIDLVPSHTYPLHEILAYAQEISRKKRGQPFEVEEVSNKDFVEDTIPDLDRKVARAKLAWQARSSKGKIFNKTSRQNDETVKAPPQLDMEEEIKSMKDLREAVMDPELPLDTEDRIECLTGLIVFSAKGEILKQLREDIKSFDPDLQLDFIKMINKGKMLAQLQAYETSIQNMQGGLYEQQRENISLLRQLWASLKPDGAMDATPGGIDLNAKNLQLDVDGSDRFQANDHTMSQRFNTRNFTGVEPVILKIESLPDILLTLGLKK